MDPRLQPLSQTIEPADSSTKTYFKWGCLAALGLAACLCLVLFAGGAGLLTKFGGDPEGLEASYDMPGQVTSGGTFELALSLTNAGETDLTVTDIDLDEAFGGSILDGAIVLATDPPMEKDYSLSGIKTFHYNRTLRPGETQTVRFTLQAVSIGEFGGSIGIYVGDKAKRFDYIGLVITN